MHIRKLSGDNFIAIIINTGLRGSTGVTGIKGNQGDVVMI